MCLFNAFIVRGKKELTYSEELAFKRTAHCSDFQQLKDDDEKENIYEFDKNSDKPINHFLDQSFSR